MITDVLALKAADKNKTINEHHKDEVDRYEYWLRTQYGNPKMFLNFEEDVEYIKNIQQLPIYERNKISIIDAYNKADWAIKTNSQIAKMCGTFDECVRYFISTFQQKTTVYKLNQFLNDYN